MKTLLVMALVAGSVAWAGPKKKDKEKPVEAAPAAPVAPSTPLVSVLPTETEAEAYKPLLAQADALMKAALEGFVLDTAAPDATDADLAAAVKAKQTVGVRVKLVLTEAREQMRASLLVTKIPGNGLRGSWFIHASGPAPDELLEAIVPAIVADAAQDLGWQKKPAEASPATATATGAPAEAPASDK
ncbi:MAG: hypothetical protein MUC96_11280 [Myxococcaceae bacterium]|jgi:hypothetical protein|nr:hypothetical protein [Myxococcaceae bacterium]